MMLLFAVLSLLVCQSSATNYNSQHYSNLIITLYNSLLNTSTAGGGPIAIATGPDSNPFVLSLFEGNVVGRNFPTGHYDTFNQVKLFFFGSASQFTEMFRVDYLQIIVDVNLRSASFRGILNFVDSPALGALATLNSTPYQQHQFGTFFFGPTGKISNFDLTTPNLAYTFDYLYAGSLLTQQIGLLCTAFNASCFAIPAGTTYLPFTGFLDCFTQISQGIALSTLPVGTWDQADADSFICRIEQLAFVTKRPDLYCSWLNVSTANSRCANRPPQEYWDQTVVYFPVSQRSAAGLGVANLAILCVVAFLNFI